MVDRLLRLNAHVVTMGRLIAYVGLGGLIVISIVTLIDVKLRWLFNSPLTGVEDFLKISIPMLVASCFPAGLALKTSITIRYLGQALGHRPEAWLEAFGQLVLLFYVTVLAWQVYRVAGQVGRQVTDNLELPIWPGWYVTAGLLMVCVLVQALVFIVHLAAATAGRTVPTAAAASE